MTVEEYLAELRRHLRAGPLAKRRILREIEAHLRDSAERERDEHGAVARFGSPTELGRALGRRRRISDAARRGAALAAAAAGGAALALAFGAGGMDVKPSPERVARCGGQNASAACLFRQAQAQRALRLVRTSFKVSSTAGYAPSTSSATTKFVVLDRRDHTLAHVTCSSDTRSGWVSPEDMSASLDAKTIMGVPNPNCARAS